MKSLPFISPLRYPGGKNWLRNDVGVWLGSRAVRPSRLIEPFAGGASVSLYAIDSCLVDEAVLVEKDPEVAAFWRVALGPLNRELRSHIMSLALNSGAVEEAVRSGSAGDLEMAFSVLVRNRLNYGGILAEGAGQLRRGEADRGLFSRWNPAGLCRRLEHVEYLSGRLSFVEGDGISEMNRQTSAKCAAFVDPPYIGTERAAGKRLYRYSDVSVDDVMSACAGFPGPFLMTHEGDTKVELAANEQSFMTHRITRMARSHMLREELLISRDLGWLKGYVVVDGTL